MFYRNIHPWNVSSQEAIEIQNRLRGRIILKKNFNPIKKIAAADISATVKKDRVVAAVVVLKFPELKLIEQSWDESLANFPYKSGLLTFREGPAILSSLNKIKSVPDLILFDGQGIAHPRRMGIAAHLGIILDKPTIGCAKSPLYGEFLEPKVERGSYSLIKDTSTGEILGAVLRTRRAVKPIFVSPGHRIDLQSAIEIVLSCSVKHRIPEPLRIAHQLANEKSL
jgi:deoxyribonuclease V